MNSDVTATLYGGVLTISGRGAMMDFTWSGAQMGAYWYNSRTSISRVVIADGVTNIGVHAFSYCTNLYSVTIGNSVTNIGEWAFQSCSNLTSVTIGSSVTTIDSVAFAFCKNLTTITIPNSVITIGNGAFSWCNNLVSVTIGNSVTTIGSSAFVGCSRLTSIIVPNSVTTVGFNAFDACTNLISVAIGNSVNSIGERAFANCTNLTEFVILNPQPPIIENNMNVFQNVNTRNIALKVPANSVNLYRAANVWRDFGSIVSYDDATLRNLTVSAGTLTPPPVTAISTNAQSAVKLYPNPTTNGELRVENEEWQEGEAVQIFSVSGTLISTYKTTGTVTSVNVSHLPNGTYILQVGRYAGKFVKK